MNVESILRAFAKHLRREEYGSAAQLANTELGDGRYDNVEHIADALDRWETGSGPLLERTFCFRSVYRSMLFEDSLRRAIGHFVGEHSLPRGRSNSRRSESRKPPCCRCVFPASTRKRWTSGSSGVGPSPGK